MKSIYLISGNQHKLDELRQIFTERIDLKLKKLNLPEIQSLDPQEIVSEKLKNAYTKTNQPVIVEDVSAELECLNGLPGPFVKYFEEKMGKGSLWRLAQGYENKNLVIRCVMGFYDGSEFIFGEGRVSGKVVSPRGDNGFGFDFVFMPDGYGKTTSQMSLEEKNDMSWRGIAARKLADKLHEKHTKE